MEKVTFTNSRGESITFDEDFSYKFIGIDGLGGAEGEVQTLSAPYQDGSTFIDTVLKDRPLTIEFALKSDPITLANMKKLMSRVFNPKLGIGTLTYEYDGGTKVIKSVPESSPFFPRGNENQTPNLQKGTVDLIAPNPYWLDVESISEPMTAYLGLFAFPLQFPTQMGEQGSKAVFTNEGDVETPIQIEFKGPATNPKVSNNTTGEFFKLNRTLAAGETLVVDTTFGNKKVEITDANGVTSNALNWIDPESTFWQLQVGDNEIEYSADAGQANAVVSITWQNRYVGI